MTALYYILSVLFIIVCVFMILLVLIQKGRGGGLAGAFGGSGGNTAFGSKTGDVLTWVTSGAFVVFVALAVALNLVANQIGTPTPKAAPPALTPQQSEPAPSGAIPSGAAAPLKP